MTDPDFDTDPEVARKLDAALISLVECKAYLDCLKWQMAGAAIALWGMLGGMIACDLTGRR